MTSTGQSNLDLTKESLRIALVQLLADNPLEKISITKLCQHAGVSRMAYYRHYHSLHHLFQDVVDNFLQTFLQQARPALQVRDWQTFWQLFFQFVYHNQTTVTQLMNGAQEIHILNCLNEMFIPQDLATNSLTSYPIRLIIGATFNLLKAWKEQDYQDAPETLAQLCIQTFTGDFPMVTPFFKDIS